MTSEYTCRWCLFRHDATCGNAVMLVMNSPVNTVKVIYDRLSLHLKMPEIHFGLLPL